MTPTHPTVSIPVSHFSSREGGRPKLIVLHTTEGGDNPTGNADLKSLGALFNSEEASSHVGNNVDGRDARFVDDAAKAWTQCYLNPVCLSIEQISFSSFSAEEWFKRPHQLANTAKWIAYWSSKYDIPIRKGLTSGTRVLRTGVVQHKNLGELGCGHSDCGSGYPIRYVRLLARYFQARDHGTVNEVSKLRRKVNRVRRHYGLDEI